MGWVALRAQRFQGTDLHPARTRLAKAVGAARNLLLTFTAAVLFLCHSGPADATVPVATTYPYGGNLYFDLESACDAVLVGERAYWEETSPDQSVFPWDPFMFDIDGGPVV